MVAGTVERRRRRWSRSMFSKQAALRQPDLAIISACWCRHCALYRGLSFARMHTIKYKFFYPIGSL